MSCLFRSYLEISARKVLRTLQLTPCDCRTVGGDGGRRLDRRYVRMCSLTARLLLHQHQVIAARLTACLLLHQQVLAARLTHRFVAPLRR